MAETDTKDGESVREMAENAGNDDAHGFEPPAIVGPKQLSLDVGGRKPDSAKIVLRNHEEPMDGSYPMNGELVPFIVWARADKVEFEDQHQAGEVIGRKKVTKFKIDSLKEVPEELASRFRPGAAEGGD